MDRHIGQAQDLPLQDVISMYFLLLLYGQTHRAGTRPAPTRRYFDVLLIDTKAGLSLKTFWIAFIAFFRSFALSATCAR